MHQELKMKSKNNTSSPRMKYNLKLIIIFMIFSLFIIYMILKPDVHSFLPNSSSSTCNKIPVSLSKSLIRYATSKITPQQTIPEISVTWRVLQHKSPCNFLVFGVGHDSLLWSSLNHGGRTVFLEESKGWMEEIKKSSPTLEMYHVVYDSKLSQAEELLAIGKSEACQKAGDPRLSRSCPLAITNLPREVYETEWDVIMVDAPVGYLDGKPGRMKVIYTAGLWGKLRRNGETHVFLHDIDRPVEDRFSKAFLCEAYMIEEVDKLRHFAIPAPTNRDRPFCS